MYMKKIFLFFFATISYIAGQGVVDFIEIRWQKESCSFDVRQNDARRNYSVIINGKTDLIMRPDTTFNASTILFKEIVFALE